MKTSKLTLLIIPLLFFACKKDPPIDPEPTEPVMPPLTHQGLNTFGCYIDGELFVANEGPSVWSIPPVSGSFNLGTRRLNLQGSRYIDFESSERDNIKIFIDVTEGESTYNFEYNDEGGTVGYRSWMTDISCDYYYRFRPDFDMGKLTITYLNEESNIIAGTFYMNLINEDCMEDTLLQITDGRFDFRY